MFHLSGTSKLNFAMTFHMQLGFPTLALCTVSLPLLSFVFCVLWSLLFNFENATFTHCGVPNYLPSISAAIGSFTPQRYIWRTCVGIHSTPRFLVVHMYYTYLCDILRNEAMGQWLPGVIFILQCLEVICLLGLTFVSSSENFHVHELCFITFMVCSLSNMLLLYLTMKHIVPVHTTDRKRSLKYKRIFGLINVTSFFLAVYFYFRHNWYCEPVVYTFFAFFEYIVVFSNMGYHMTACWDFSDYLIFINSCCKIWFAPKTHPSGGSLRDVVIKVA